MNWKEYEKSATRLLKEKFDKETFKIILQGEEDSTKPDIIITAIDKNKSFFLEVKMPNAQSSQFVLEIDDNKFVYGSRNRYKNNFFSQAIIDYMNDNFKKYNKVFQSGIKIPISEGLINDWIITNLENKGIEYVLSGSVNNERIIPINKFGDYFKTTAFFRRKKSGSRNLAKNKIEDFISSFKNKFNFSPKVIGDGKKSYIKIDKKINDDELHIPSISNKRIVYYLSRKDQSKYEIKILSSTNNPNVIFRLTVKNSDAIGTYDLKMFANLIIEQLKEN